MEDLNQLLQESKTSGNARRIQALYEQLSGNKLNTGCFCKQNNINKVYTIVEDWVRRQQ